MITCIRTLALFLALPTLIFFCLGTFSHALPIPPEGQALVTDNSGGTDNKGIVFIIDLGDGQRAVLSDFGDPSQGPLGEDPIGIVLQDLDTALVADEDAGTNGRGALFSVDLITGNRVIISDFGDPLQGPLGDNPTGVALNTDGNALVVDDAPDVLRGRLFLVDLTPGPTFGQRTLISDFSNPAQGPLGEQPKGVALDGNGNALVADEGGVAAQGTLFHVDLNSGQRTVISNFGDPSQGPIGGNPFGVALDSFGNALVADQDGGGGLDGILFLVNLTTGLRTIVSDFKNPAQGPLGGETQDVVLDLDRNALVVDSQGGSGTTSGLLLVNLTRASMFGDRTLISDFGDPSQGPVSSSAQALTLRARTVVSEIPTLSEWGLIATAAVLGLAGLYAARRKKLTA